MALGFSNLQSRRLRSDLIALHSFLRRGHGEGGAELFSLLCSDRTCGNDSKLHQERCRLDIRKHFFTDRVVKHWNRLPRVVIDAPCPSVFKRHLDNALDNMLYLWLDWMIIVGPFQLKIFYSILFYSILFYSILFYSILFYSILISEFSGC